MARRGGRQSNRSIAAYSSRLAVNPIGRFFGTGGLTRIAAFGVQLAIDNYFSRGLDDAGLPSNHQEP